MIWMLKKSTTIGWYWCWYQWFWFHGVTKSRVATACIAIQNIVNLSQVWVNWKCCGRKDIHLWTIPSLSSEVVIWWAVSERELVNNLEVNRISVSALNVDKLALSADIWFRVNNLEVNRISVSALNVDKLALSADIWFRPKAVVSHSVHFRFRRAAVGKFGGCQK